MLKQYLSEVKAEINKVSWPSKQKTLKDSFVVITASLVMAIFLGVADACFSYLAEKVITR